ncbi:hypothetical protein HSE3_gp093 [Bacillus phage vB_BceM-HSE3]|nr:hypothetical protein HSE3_gp093 [Bacillus phage vB_BceM-HSE3]
MELKCGQLIFVKGTSTIGRLITRVDKGDFSHVAIALSSDRVLEAKYLEKLKITKFDFTQQYEIIDLNLTETQQLDLVDKALEYEGLSYDYLQILGYLLRKWLGLTDITRFNNPNQLICSELIENVLLDIGMINRFQYIKGKTPNELYNYLIKLQGTR